VFSKGKEAGEASGSLPRANKDDVLAELMEISKTLGETIKTSTTRKAHVDNLIKSIMQEAEVEGENGAENDEEAEEN
jgi:hypothetical protein